MFSLMYAWINDWVNNRDAGDLRHHRAHYDVIVMWLHRTNESLSSASAKSVSRKVQNISYISHSRFNTRIDNCSSIRLATAMRWDNIDRVGKFDIVFEFQTKTSSVSLALNPLGCAAKLFQWVSFSWTITFLYQRWSSDAGISRLGHPKMADALPGKQLRGRISLCIGNRHSPYLDDITHVWVREGSDNRISHKCIAIIDCRKICFWRPQHLVSHIKSHLPLVTPSRQMKPAAVVFIWHGDQQLYWDSPVHFIRCMW